MMKKFVLAVIAVITVASLVACDNQKKPEVSPKTEVVNNMENVNAGSSDDGNVDTTSVLTNEEMYGKLIEDYQKALSEYDLENLDMDEAIEQKYQLVDPFLLAHITRYSANGTQLTYGFYDIDKNGIDELIVGASGSHGAIYSYDKTSHQPVKIFFQDTMERGTLLIYDNGVILSEGAGGAALHYYGYGKIAENGVTYEAIENIEEEYMDVNESPVYRDAKTGESLAYKSLEEINDKYLADSKVVESIEK